MSGPQEAKRTAIGRLTWAAANRTLMPTNLLARKRDIMILESKPNHKPTKENNNFEDNHTHTHKCTHKDNICELPSL